MRNMIFYATNLEYRGLSRIELYKLGFSMVKMSMQLSAIQMSVITINLTAKVQCLLTVKLIQQSTFELIKESCKNMDHLPALHHIYNGRRGSKSKLQRNLCYREFGMVVYTL